MNVTSTEGPEPAPPSSDVVTMIVGASMLVDRFGRWPAFTDAELISLALDRGDLMNAFETGGYSTAVHPSATATFHVFDASRADGSPDRKDALATLRFVGLDWIVVRGFNHQNPLLGLELSRLRSDRLGADLFAVRWGGTVMGHDVSLTCAAIEVTALRDLADPAP